jgi:hypothetical protein
MWRGVPLVQQIRPSGGNLLGDPPLPLAIVEIIQIFENLRGDSARL